MTEPRTITVIATIELYNDFGTIPAQFVHDLNEYLIQHEDDVYSAKIELQDNDS